MDARPDRIPLSLNPAAPLRLGAQCLVRGAITCLTAEVQKRSPKVVSADLYPQQREAMNYMQRGATTPFTSTPTTVFAQVGTGLVDLLNLMGAASASSGLLNSGLQLMFGGGIAALSVPMLKADPANINWLGESSAISVRQFETNFSILAPYKLPVISVFTRELFLRSFPNIEDVVRAVLTESIGLALDATLFDTIPSDGLTRPAGLRFNVAALTASSNTARTEAMTEDVSNLIAGVAPVAGNSPIVLIASPAQAAVLRLWARSELPSYPIMGSGALSNKMVIAVAARALVSAADPAPRFSVADAAVVHMDTSAQDVGSGGIPAGGTVKSIFQADLIGLKTILEISWGLRASGAVAWVQNVLW